MIMDHSSDISPQSGDSVAISEPNEPGSFKGDVWYGHPEKRTLGTHQWDGDDWRVLPSELDSCLQLLAQERDENKRLRSLLTDCPARHSMHGCPSARAALDARGLAIVSKEKS